MFFKTFINKQFTHTHSLNLSVIWRGLPCPRQLRCQCTKISYWIRTSSNLGSGNSFIKFSHLSNFLFHKNIQAINNIATFIEASQWESLWPRWISVLTYRNNSPDSWSPSSNLGPGETLLANFEKSKMAAKCRNFSRVTQLAWNPEIKIKVY